MIHRVLTIAAKTAAQAGHLLALHARAAAAAASIHRLWDRHCQLMDQHTLYRAVITGLASVLTQQLSIERSLSRFVAVLLATFTTARPGERHLFDDDPDDWPDPA